MQLISVLAALVLAATVSAQTYPIVGTNPTLIQTEIDNPQFAPFIEASGDYDGADVVIISDTAFNGANKTWTVVQGGGVQGTTTGPVTQIRIFGDKCLDVPNGNNIDGQKLQIWTCYEGNTNQLWTVNGDGTITWAGNNKCVDLTDGNLSDGTRIQIWTCTSLDINQAWGYVPPRSSQKARSPGSDFESKTQLADSTCLSCI